MKYELIVFLLIVAGNGAVALWKKWNERKAAQPAPRSPAPATARAPQPAAAPPRSDSRAKLERRLERARVKAAAATNRAQQPMVAPRRPQATTAESIPHPAASASITVPALSAGKIDRESLRRTILLGELLGPPRALRPYR